jgi:hypothetical protein
MIQEKLILFKRRLKLTDDKAQIFSPSKAKLKSFHASKNFLFVHFK